MNLFSVYRFSKAALAVPAAALGLPPHACRFTPSCSHYCEQAIHQHGPFRGTSLCFRRLLRCHPGTPAGYDPVPR